MSAEQERILDDNETRCTSDEIISYKFNEFFDEEDMYEQIVEVYGEEEIFEDVPNEDEVVDESHCCSLNPTIPIFC